MKTFVLNARIEKFPTDVVRFIATSTAMLKWLQEIKESDTLCYCFVFSDNEIKLPEIKRTYHCNDMQGCGVIEVGRQDISRLKRILREMQEQPIVFYFSNNLISLQHITI